LGSNKNDVGGSREIDPGGIVPSVFHWQGKRTERRGIGSGDFRGNTSLKKIWEPRKGELGRGHWGVLGGRTQEKKALTGLARWYARGGGSLSTGTPVSRAVDSESSTRIYDGDKGP